MLHDYSGHPFQLELAEELARRGFEVTHFFCSSIPTTPQAVTGTGQADHKFSSRAIALEKPIVKGAFFERFFLERHYGQRLASEITAHRPEVVIFSNTPVDALGPAMRAAQNVGAARIVWVQDLLGEAALRILPARLGILGKAVGHFYCMREERLLAQADHLVAITEDFAPIFKRAGLTSERWTVIPNWAPLGKIIPRPKNNPWSREQGLEDKTVFLYSGTLGFKHNPALLLELARALHPYENAVVIVNSEGEAADWLKIQAQNEGLTQRLRVNGFQPFSRISDVLAAADVLVTILEPEAGIFSVPSKVLSNHCAGRAQLLAMPSDNLAAKIVQECGSGLICDPTDPQGFVRAALSLIHDVDLRRNMGEKARIYAEKHFEIGRIADRFQAVIETAIQKSH